MTQEETLKRIEGEADKVADRWTAIQLRDLYRDGFIAGAKSERNKVLDEAIAYLKSREKEQYDYFLNDSEDKHAYGKYCAFTEAAEELESLKL